MYDLLKEELQFNGLSQEVVADNLGITRRTLWNKLNGKTPWQLWEAISIKQMLNSDETLEYLFHSDPFDIGD